jgi:hypothetical protein
MAHGTRNIAAGTTGSLTPDPAVAVDIISSVDYQRTKLADATEGSTSAIGIAANPLKVQNRRRGSADYDSGLVAVTNGSPASVTSSTIYPEGGFISNTSASQRKVTLTDGGNNAIATINVAPESTIPMPIPKSGSWAGLKAGADGTGVVLQVSGAQ